MEKLSTLAAFASVEEPGKVALVLLGDPQATPELIASERAQALAAHLLRAAKEARELARVQSLVRERTAT